MSTFMLKKTIMCLAELSSLVVHLSKPVQFEFEERYFKVLEEMKTLDLVDEI